MSGRGCCCCSSGILAAQCGWGALEGAWNFWDRVSGMSLKLVPTLRTQLWHHPTQHLEGTVVPSRIIPSSVHPAGGKARSGLRVWCSRRVSGCARLEKEPKTLGRAVGPGALFIRVVVTWLLTLGFQDQLPNSPLSQREWLPGVQKIERKIEKNLEKC